MKGHTRVLDWCRHAWHGTLVGIARRRGSSGSPWPRVLVELIEGLDPCRSEEDRRFLERIRELSGVALGLGSGGQVRESGEEGLLRHLVGVLPSRATLLDVGANKGVYTLAAHRIVPEVRIHCLEPARAAFVELESAVASLAGIQAWNIALGESPGEAPLYTNAPGSELGSLYQRRLDHLGVDLHSTEMVRVVSLDDFCDTHGVDNVDLLKLDVEGHEFSVLRGAKGSMERSAIGLIQFEFGGCNVQSRTYFRDFFDLLAPTFRIFRVLPQGLIPIDDYSETNEVFLTTNYLAVNSNCHPHLASNGAVAW